jgi:glutamate formiminotransferase
LLQSVVNVSEGRDAGVIGALAERGGESLLDLHCDRDHNRSVFTLAGDDVEGAVRRLARHAVAALDLRKHHGAHPRLGVLDVVPWIDLVVDTTGRWHNGRLETAAAARDRFARWAATELDLPCFTYGSPPPAGWPPAGWPSVPDVSVRTLPYVRKEAWRTLLPDTGPARPHRSAGATCVGARPVLVAYNLWLATADLVAARRIAAEVRSPQLRTLGLQVGAAVQVSCNLIDPWTVGPDAAFDAVATRVEVARAELVGLVPLGVLDAIPSSRWALLDVDASRTIEARLEQAGLDGGRFTYQQPPTIDDTFRPGPSGSREV